MIVFNCPSCNLQIKVPDQASGRTGTCPRCHLKVRVPDQELPAAPLSAAPAVPAPAPAESAGSGSSASGAQVPCPSCGEMISAQAKKCRFCGEELTPAQVPCPSCGEMISSRATQCRFCGEPLGRPTVPARRPAPSSRYDDDDDDYEPRSRGRGTGRHPSVRGRRSSPKNEKSEWDKGFGDYIGICFSKYADFNGRATRKEFWYIQLFIFLVALVPFLGWLAPFVFFLPQLSLGWRRCHDINKSGALWLIPTLAFVIGAIVIFVGMLGGAAGADSYDHDTRAVASLFMGGGFVLGLGIIFVGGIVPFIIGLLPGTPGPNRFGPDPYDNDDDSDDDYDDYDDRRPRSRRRRR